MWNILECTTCFRNIYFSNTYSKTYSLINNLKKKLGIYTINILINLKYNNLLNHEIIKVRYVRNRWINYNLNGGMHLIKISVPQVNTRYLEIILKYLFDIILIAMS